MSHRDVRIDLPPDERFLQIARLAVVSLATVSGIDHHVADELRLAVDTLCHQLMQQGDNGSPVRLLLGADGRALRVVGQRDGGERAPLDADLLPAFDGLDVRVERGDDDVDRFEIAVRVDAGSDDAP